MKKNLIYLTFLSIVVLVAVYPLLFGNFYTAGDMRDVYIPLESFFHNEQLNFRLPAWNPDISWGFPVIASAQIGFFYPPLLLLRFLPIWLYLPILIITHLILLSVGMFIFMRQQKTSAFASFLTATSFTLSGFVFQHLTHLNILLNITWLPWQFIVAQHLAKKKKISLKDISLFAIVIGLSFLAGHPQISIMTAAVSSLYFFILRFKNHSTKKTIAIIILTAFFAFTLSAAQLLPTLELSQYSSRGPEGSFSIEQANQHSFPLYHLPTAIFPKFFGSDNTYWGKRLEVEYGFFIGTIPLLLALFASFYHFKKHRFFILLGSTSFLLAMGNLSPFRLIGLEPSLWIFSAPARWLLFTTFTGSILAGFGFDLLFDHLVKFKKYIFKILTITVTTITTINIFIWIPINNLSQQIFYLLQTYTPQLLLGRPDAYYLDKLSQIINSLQATSVSLSSPYTYLPIILLAVTPWLLKYKKVWLALITAELIIIAATSNPATSWKNILTPPNLVHQLPQSVQDKQARIFTYLPSDGDTGLWLTNPKTRANSSTRQQQRESLVPLTSSQFNIPGVQWPASLDLQKQSNILNKIVKNNRPNLSLASDLNIETIVLNNNIININNPSPRAEMLASKGIASYQAISPSYTQVITTDEQADTLLVRDTWYPGWQTKIDGKPTNTYSSDGIFRKINVPAGTHTIDMRYIPNMLYIGILLSSLSFITLLFWAIRPNR